MNKKQAKKIKSAFNEGVEEFVSERKWTKEAKERFTRDVEKMALLDEYLYEGADQDILAALAGGTVGGVGSKLLGLNPLAGAGVGAAAGGLGSHALNQQNPLGMTEEQLLEMAQLLSASDEGQRHFLNPLDQLRFPEGV